MPYCLGTGPGFTWIRRCTIQGGGTKHSSGRGQHCGKTRTRSLRRTSVPARVGTSSAPRSSGSPRAGATPATPTLAEGISTVLSSRGQRRRCQRRKRSDQPRGGPRCKPALSPTQTASRPPCPSAPPPTPFPEPIHRTRPHHCVGVVAAAQGHTTSSAEGTCESSRYVQWLSGRHHPQAALARCFWNHCCNSPCETVRESGLCDRSVASERSPAGPCSGEEAARGGLREGAWLRETPASYIGAGAMALNPPCSHGMPNVFAVSWRVVRQEGRPASLGRDGLCREC